MLLALVSKKQLTKLTCFDAVAIHASCCAVEQQHDAAFLYIFSNVKAPVLPSPDVVSHPALHPNLQPYISELQPVNPAP